MVAARSGRRLVEDERGGGGNVANVQVLPVTNVANVGRVMGGLCWGRRPLG